MKNISPLSIFMLAAGVAAAGWFVGNGLVESRANDHFVTVKGLSEREVSADVAVWTLTFMVSNNSLTEARTKLADDRQAVLGFLKNHQISSDDIDLQGFRIVDRLALAESKEKIAVRFLLQQSISVRSVNVAAVAAASQKVGALLDAGVLFGNVDGYYLDQSPNYIFTGLNKIKPDMIGEATANARLAAQKFARDAQTEIKGIRRAQQGRFEILAAGGIAGGAAGSQIRKKVRVVTTLDYVLKK